MDLTVPAAAIAVAFVALGLWWRDTRRLDIGVLRCTEALPASNFIMINDMQIHVVDEGTGPLVVMLHGNVNSLRLWDAWAAALLTFGYRVIRFDLPPYGLSGSSSRERHGIAATYQVLDTLLRSVPDRRVILIGAANGGPPAAWWASRNPRRAAGLILVNTPFFAPISGLSPAFDRQKWLQEKIWRWTGRPSLGTQAYVARLMGDEKAPDSFVMHVHRVGRRSDVRNPLSLYGSSFVMPDAEINPEGLGNRSMLSKLPVSTLLMWGERALLPQGDGHALLGSFADGIARIEIYSGAGHWFPAAGAQKPIDDMRRFIQCRFSSL